MTGSLQERIARLRWALPVSFALLAVVYQLVLASWVHDRYGDPVHYVVEVIFYASAGPLLAFWVLGRISRWLDDKETAEMQARASDRRLAAITSASADAMLSLDPTGRVQAANDGADLLFDSEGAGLVGRDFHAVLGRGLSGQEEVRWLLDAAGSLGYVQGHETEFHSAGRRVSVEITATRLSDDTGDTAGFSLIVRDVTARRQREEEIRRLNAGLNDLVAERTGQLAEKVEELARANADLTNLDRMRAEFVSLVSHQIRAPLTNMRGAIETMQATCDAPTQAACGHTFTIVSDQISRLERLVTTVLSASSLENGEFSLHVEPVSLVPLAHRAAEHFQNRARGRPIVSPNTPGLPLAYADPERTEEILANLLDNADKYSPPGEPVEISLRADSVEIVIAVRDRGDGIPQAELSRVFERFYRADGSDSQTAYGYGLGLYVCRLLAEAQGGRIWAENHPEGGAVFSLALPVTPSGEEPAAGGSS